MCSTFFNFSICNFFIHNIIYVPNLEHWDYTNIEFFSPRILTTSEIEEIVEDENFWKDVKSVDVFITPPDDGVET